MTRSEGRTAAAAILARDSGPGWQGTIGFTLDPPGGSKYEILEGQNIRVLGWQGENVLLHIASVDVNSEDLEYPVQITVDSKARDYPTLDAIRGRERDAVDPARVAFKALTTSKVQSDAIVYDSESPAGRVPKHPITANLWDVRQIPMGAWGDIVKMSFRTTSPARPFALALFGKKITAAQLNAIVGNVMTTSATESPWEEHGDELDDYAFINAWGWKQQPQGYYPRSYANPLGETTAPVTGRLYDTLGMTYATDNPPWLYVATISTGACYIEGRIYGELVLD